MDLSLLLQLGASVIQGSSDHATTGIPLDKLCSALSDLLGGKSGKPDFGALLACLHGKIAASWLGNGANQPISPDALSAIIDMDQLKAYATKLGISLARAKTAIADALPAMIDKASPDGSQLDDLATNFGSGGLGGIFDAAKKLL
ncbi:MAG: YidB family protein [Chlorobium sp.]|uniref:YidB family protein n=1 Tax=Chlorobium sp. TaxID=1095 RepID=UPI0025BAD8BD|nr:YidB family protein [Chlorobium sp.]MCF8215440.1 YidB family protein [Chlorobium sp.]MCF8270335.1 YidB family protein [Chlorobium sp.]MCF8286647.1 YidB family protein [Chlorobium sp.]MCF8290340.1 YidB family protein [Chlorobium sp.]MCF8384223.1 YidB family protein [Chlorobium sp.]